MNSIKISHNDVQNLNSRIKSLFSDTSEIIKKYVIITALGIGFIIFVVLNINTLNTLIFYSTDAMHLLIPSTIPGLILFIALVKTIVDIFGVYLIIEYILYERIFNLGKNSDITILEESGKELLKGFKFQILFLNSLIIFIINSSFLHNFHYFISKIAGVDLYYVSLIICSLLPLSFFSACLFYHIKGYFTFSNWTGIIAQHDQTHDYGIIEMNLGSNLAKYGLLINIIAPGVGKFVQIIGLWKIQKSFTTFAISFPKFSQETQTEI